MRSGRAPAESSRLGSALLTPENPEADPRDTADNRAGNSRISLPPGEDPVVEGVARILNELAIPLVVGWRGRGCPRVVPGRQALLVQRSVDDLSVSDGLPENHSDRRFRV